MRAASSVVNGGSGSYQAGSIWTDGNWGMLLRAKQASPALAEFSFAKSDDTKLLTILSSGNVGIGTTTPGMNLDVASSGTGNSAGLVVRTSDSHSVSIKPSHVAGGNNGIVQGDDQALIFSNGTMETGAFVIAPWSAGTSGLRMTATGNVGIGTTNPGAKLDTIGIARISNGNSYASSSLMRAQVLSFSAQLTPVLAGDLVGMPTPRAS